MAYTLRYYKTLPQPGDRDIVLEIYEKDGEGASMEIGPVIQALHLDIQGSQEDIDTPVVKTSLVMTFVDAPDHEEASSKKCGNWEEFYTPDSTYWKVVLKKRTASGSFSPIWGGYVTPDSFTEQLRYRGSVTIVARDNIGHMQDFPFDAKGNEDGMITVYDLVNAAWAKIESPMSLNWRGEEDEAMWLQCDGHDVTGAYLNVSAFKGMNWYEAMEKVLYSIGAVMRYVGDNTVQVSSLRYMPYQGRASMSSLAEIEPKFIAHANRELAPAVRRIEESVKYDLVEDMQPLVSSEDFSGAVSDAAWGAYTAPVWPLINTASGNGWGNAVPSSAMYFNPQAYAIDEPPFLPAFEQMQEDIYNSMYLLCDAGQAMAEYSRGVTPANMSYHMRLGRTIQLYGSDTSGYVIVPSMAKIYRIRYAVKVTEASVEYFLQSDGSWSQDYAELEAYNDGNDCRELNGMLNLSQFSGGMVLHLYVTGIESDAAGLAITYASVQMLSFAASEGEAYLQTNNINTANDESNNVILSRDPAFGPAYNLVALPGIIKNGMFIKSGDVYLPAKAWAWSGGTPQQMAVYNHLQLLCYHAKPNNVITGDIVNADLGNLRALYMWHGSEHLLQGGSLNFLNGRIEGAILREFARYDDMWGDVTGDSMPATEQESSTNVEEGGSSSGSSATYENTTNVTIGGSGGGSVTVDTFLSDTSTNPVQNRAIKAYVDSVDNQLEEKIGNLAERIDSLENGTSGGAGAVIFDATCSTDPWNLNILQTSTTIEEIANAINNGSPIYMRFGSGLVAVANAELYENGDVSLYAHLVDSESEIIRTIHTYSTDGGWSWESTDNPVGGGGDVDTAMSATSTNAVQNKVIKTYVDNAETRAYDNAIVEAGRYTDSQVASKAGAFYLVPESNLFLAFTTEEAKNEYITTGSTNQSNILFQQVIQGGGGSGDTTDTYRMTILGLDESYNYTTASETMPISCTFKSEVKRAGEDTYEVVPEAALFTVVVYKSTGTVSTVANGVIVNNGGTFNFDLKPYVGNGENTVTVKATGLISSKDGNAYTKVNVTTMSLAPFGFAWYNAWKQGQDYLISLKVQGALNKTLHVKINNNEITESLGTFSSDSTPKVFTLKSSYHPASTGVYNLKIWMTADSSGVSSEVLNYNIMCVKSSDVNTAKLVCINEVATFADNYAESKLFSYATYNGGGASSTPTLSITKGSTTIVSNTVSATTGVAYDFTYAFSLDMSESSASIVAKAVFGNTQSATITLRNETAFAPVGGYSFYMDAATRSNSDPYKTYLQNEANSQRVNASWTDMAWVDGMDGWTTDEDGNKCLLIPAMSKANVNFAPMQNISTVTIEMFYKVKNVSDFDEEIITIATATASSWKGLKIKPTNICLHSRLLFSDDLKQSYNVQDEKPVHLVIAVNSNYLEHGNVAIIYVNGVKKCTFEWGANDSFAHSGNLMLGSSTADLYLYKIRVYGFQFDWPQVMQNYISCLTTAADKSKTKRREDSVLDDNNQVDYDKVYGKYNTFVVELPKGAVLPNRKDNSSNIPIEGSNLYINIVQDPSCSIQGEFLNVPLEGQGTTAMTYYRWNLRSKTDTIRITAKKNVASSMQSHKRGATALYNDLNLALVGANDANGRVAVYQYPVYGFQKIEYEDTPGTYYYDFIGLYTIGPDKGDKPTFGYDNSTYKSSLIHMEGTDHSPRGVGMDYPWELMTVGLNKSGDTCLGSATFGGVFSAAWEIGACCNKENDDFTGIKEDLDKEFAPAYKIDYECTPMIVGLPLGDTIEDANADISNFRAQIADNGFAYSDCIIYDNNYYTYYYDEVSKTYVKDDRMVYDGLTSAHGYSKSTLDSKSSVLAKTLYIRECRKARYRAEMEQYWHLDDSLFHACFLDLIGATDNEKKNSYPYKFKPLASQGKWRWRQDDLDTIFDVNNQGFADKKYSILNTDKQGTTMIFKGNTSYHWRCIREYYKNEMKAMMQRIFAKMVELCPSGYGSSNIQKLVGCIRHYFWDYAQEYFTGGAYNLDARWTYEDAWRIGAPNAVPVLQQSLGSHYEAEVAWVTMRMLFLASMYEFGAFSDYQDSSEGQIKFRQGGDFTFTLTPAVDMRPAIASGQSVVIYASGRVLAGNSVAIATSSETGADTDVYIQGADWMQDVGDFSTVTVGSQAQPFEVASKRLQKLKVGDATASKVTTNIARVAIHECPSLIEIDARNIAALANTVDLTKCPRLRRAYFGGTSLTSITLPEGSKIQAYGLPSTIQSLELRKLPLLTTSGLIYDNLNALTYVWVEDNKNLDGYDLLKNALEDGSPLNNIRVIGFNKTATAEDTDFLLELASGDYHGITPAGAVDNTIPPVLVGTVNYDTIDGDVYDALKAAYGNNLTINYNKLIAFIKFVDPEVLRVLIANGVDTNNDGGIEVDEAEAVTSISYTVFHQNTAIVSFDEFQYFTGITHIPSDNANNDLGLFYQCTALKHLIIPTSVTSIGRAAFAGCTSLTSIGDTSNVKTIAKSAFNGSGLEGTVNYPLLEGTLEDGTFMGTNIERVDNLGKVTTMPYTGYNKIGQFAGCKHLIFARLPSTLTAMGKNTFDSCELLATVICEAAYPPTITNTTFSGCAALTAIYVPDASVAAYQAATNWSQYSERIKPLSEYTE